jgi:hypothetical protein
MLGMLPIFDMFSRPKNPTDINKTTGFLHLQTLPYRWQDYQSLPYKLLNCD